MDNNKNKKYLNRLRERLNRDYTDDNRTSVLITTKMLLKYYETNEKLTNTESFIKDVYNISCIYLDYSIYDFAEKYFLLALEKSEALIPFSSLTANIYNNLAVCYSRRNKYEDAYTYFSKAINIFKNSSGENSIDYIDGLYNLGSVLFDLGDLDKSIFYYMEALNRRKKKDLDYIDNLNNLGYVFEAKEDYESSLKYLLQALTYVKGIEGINSNEYMSNTYYIASVYEHSKNYDLAISYYEKSVSSMKLIIGEKHPFYAEVLNKMSNTYLKLNNTQKALILRMKSLNIIGETMGKNHIYYANNIRGLVNIYVKDKNYDKAIKFSEEELEIKEKIIGKNGDDYIKTALRLADIYISSNFFDKSASILSEIVFDEKNFNSKLYLDCLYMLVRLYEQENLDDKLYDIYSLLQTNNPDVTFDIMLDCAKNSESSTKQKLYNEELSIHIGKSMDINISKPGTTIELYNDKSSDDIDNNDNDDDSDYPDDDFSDDE